MRYALALFPSITLANKIKRYFSSDGSSMHLMHAPPSLTNRGCAHCLKFKYSKLPEVKYAVDKYDIANLGFYEEIGNNRYLRLDI